MSTIDIISGLAILLIVHVSLSFIVSKEIRKNKKMNKTVKLVWHLFVWFIPILGGVLANLYFKIARISPGTSSNSQGSDNT
ncbi:hypothetical protein ACVBE9_12265 [Eionea flava]